MSLHDALREFGRELTANFAVAELNPAQAEDQLKGPVQRLLSAAGDAAGLDVVARTEARTDLGVRPDLSHSDGAGRRSSALDAIRPVIWPAQFTEDLVRLLWVVEHTVALTPGLNAVLAAIVEGPTIQADELPTPSEGERQPPTAG